MVENTTNTASQTPVVKTAFLIVERTDGGLDLVTAPDRLNIPMLFESSETDVRKYCYQVMKDLEATMYASRVKLMMSATEEEKIVEQ